MFHPWLVMVRNTWSKYRIGDVFSSAADIIIGAYLMPNGPSLSVNLIFKSIRLLQFLSDLPIFGLNVHNNIAQKVVEVEI